MYGHATAALLVFLPRAARARGVPPDFGSGAPWLRRAGTRFGLPMVPEIPICLQQPSRHVHDHIFPLLRADRLGAHLRVFVVLVAEHHHRDKAAAALLVVDQLSPAIVAHAHAPHEAVSPVVTVSHAILVLQQDRPVDLILVQCCGDGVPVTHHQPQDFVGFVQTAELAGVRHLAAEDLRIVLARHDNLRACDEGGEESVERLDVHRPAALAAFEEVSEAIKLGVGQRLVLGEGPNWESPGIVNNRLRYHPRVRKQITDTIASPRRLRQNKRRKKKVHGLFDISGLCCGNVQNLCPEDGFGLLISGPWDAGCSQKTENKRSKTMSFLDDVRDAKQRFGTYIERLQRLLQEYKVEGKDWYANLKLANRDPEFRKRRNDIWNELLEQEGATLSLPVILAIVGAMLGGIGIAGFGGAIGLPLAWLLCPVGILLGNEFDREGVSKEVLRTIRKFFGSSEGTDSKDDAADSAHEELAFLLEQLTEITNRCDVLEHAREEMAARCNAVERENATLNADVAKLSDQLVSLKSIVEVAQTEVVTLRQRTMYLGWGVLIVGVLLISELILGFFH
jgi:hypothetical protein